MRLKPDSVIVFEGLDAAGKSTQADHLISHPEWSAPPDRIHMPSGDSAFTSEVYRLMELESPTSGLAKQLFHVACHAESIDTLRARRPAGVLVDRWWWSTIAYSANLGAADRAFIRVAVDHVWADLNADLIVCFLHPFRTDENNLDGIAAGYRSLVEGAGRNAIVLEPGPPQERTVRLVDELRDRDLLA